MMNLTLILKTQENRSLTQITTAELIKAISQLKQVYYYYYHY